MKFLKPSLMIPQIEDLPRIMREETAVFSKMTQDIITSEEAKRINHIFITGDGDSYHAALSAEMAFETIAGIHTDSISAQRFLNYKIEWLPLDKIKNCLLIGISSSGTTRRVINSVERANEFGVLTIGISGRPESALLKVADRDLCVELPFVGPSPGIRSYNASLLGLYLTAIRIGELNGNIDSTKAESLRLELSSLSDTMESVIKSVNERTREAVRMFKDAQYLMFLGSGPSYGTAVFSAAKMVEAAGLFAMGQDLEEWTHVEFFAYPEDTPTFIIAPPGQSHWRAVELTEMTKTFGRRVAAVIQEGDSDISNFADFVLPVAGDVREEFSSLVYHIPSDYFACYLAEELNRHLFRSDNADFQKSNLKYLSRDRKT